MFKRFLALILCVIMVLPLIVSCNSDSGVPEGMYSVTLDGEPFVFYVPETWTDNRDSGISSAYYSLSKGIMATAKHFACDQEIIDKGIEAYVADIKAQNAELLKDQKYSLKKEGEDRLSGSLAQKYVYEYDYDGESEYNLTVSQYYTFHAGNIVVLSLYVMTDYFSEVSDDFSKIKNNFVLCEKKVSDKVETAENGMKKASSDDMQYVCYVPKTWETNLDTKITYAYFPESGSPNVTVTCYSPDQDYTVAQFYEVIEHNYKKGKCKKCGFTGCVEISDNKTNYEQLITNYPNHKINFITIFTFTFNFTFFITRKLFIHYSISKNWISYYRKNYSLIMQSHYFFWSH